MNGVGSKRIYPLERRQLDVWLRGVLIERPKTNHPELASLCLHCRGAREQRSKEVDFSLQTPAYAPCDMKLASNDMGLPDPRANAGECRKLVKERDCPYQAPQCAWSSKFRGASNTVMIVDQAE